MRWTPRPTKTPGVDKRTVRRFAFLPTLAETDTMEVIVWLERRTDSPPRSFDGILSVGPLRWRIYREHPWNGNHIAFLSADSPPPSNTVDISRLLPPQT